MKKDYYILCLSIALRLILMFICAVCGTFIYDYLQEINFFGDYSYRANDFGHEYTKEVWGARHYYFNWLVFFLMCLSIITLVFFIVTRLNEISEKNTPTKQ